MKIQKGGKYDPEEIEKLMTQTADQMAILRQKHPDCIPIFFARHKDAPSSMKTATKPLILFKKDLKIEQAMLRLYQQIQTKGLYFFCILVVKQKARYVKIKPGPTIEQLYEKYGRNNFLTLIYGNSEMGLQGLQKMEKILIRLLIVVVIIWGSLYAYKYFNRQPDAQPTPK